MYESNGYVEEDWYEPRYIDSLRDHYLEEDVQYILRRHEEKWGAAEAKEVIELMGNAN